MLREVEQEKGLSMCANIIIDGVEYDDFGGECSCSMKWPEIMEFIGQHTERPEINESIIIKRDPFDYVVETKRKD